MAGPDNEVQKKSIPEQLEEIAPGMMSAQQELLRETVKIASPEDFRPKGEPVTLPSGLTVLAIRPSPFKLLESSEDGDIPNPLATLISSYLTGQEVRPEDLTIEDLKSLESTLDLLVKAGFLQPRIWNEEDCDATHIPLGWVDFLDKVAFFQWALGGLQAIAAQQFPTPAPEDLETL